VDSPQGITCPSACGISPRKPIALCKETTYQYDKQEEKEEDVEADDDVGDEKEEAGMEGEKSTSHTCNQHKTSSRRKRIPLTRTDDFLWE
jgi:hypothetical protein